MNYELFIAKRIIAAKEYKSSISSPIIKIAIIAIALGMIIMMIAIATSTGLQQKIRGKISGFNGHIQITNFDNNNSEITLDPISKNQDFYPEFKSIENIEHIQVFATKAGIIRTEIDFEGVVLKGVSTDYNWSFFEEYLVEGDLPLISDTISNKILISREISNKLSIYLNDNLNMFFLKENQNKRPNLRVFEISGIYDTGFQDFDKNIIIGDLGHIQKMNKWNEDEVGGFEVLLNDFTDLNNKSIEIYKEIPSALNSQSVIEKYPTIFEWIRLFDNNTYLIIAIMILVAGINMITALLVLILERTQMIGLLKALGSHTKSIRKIFLYNATYLILKGLFWGNLIGLTLLLIQKFTGVISLNPETYYVREVPVYLDFRYIILLNLGTLILCLLMLIIPTLIISKVNPSKSIKFE